jgi:hypothetical protein
MFLHEVYPVSLPPGFWDDASWGRVSEALSLPRVDEWIYGGSDPIS